MARRELFGEVAVRLGFAKPRDVKQALAYQQDLNAKGRKHLLIGLVMHQLSILDTSQVIAVLKEMEKRVSSTRIRIRPKIRRI